MYCYFKNLFPEDASYSSSQAGLQTWAQSLVKGYYHASASICYLSSAGRETHTKKKDQQMENLEKGLQVPRSIATTFLNWNTPLTCSMENKTKQSKPLLDCDFFFSFGLGFFGGFLGLGFFLGFLFGWFFGVGFVCWFFFPPQKVTFTRYNH